MNIVNESITSSSPRSLTTGVDELLNMLDSPRSTFDDSDADPEFIPTRQRKGAKNILNSPKRKKSTTPIQLIDSNFTSSEPSTSKVIFTDSILSPRIVVDKSRKRKLKKSTWMRTVKKTLRESGREYYDEEGKKHQSRKVKQAVNCEKSCKLKCTALLSEDERLLLHASFWKLTDIEKNHYYSKFVTRMEPKRKRTKNIISRKKFSYKYHFELNSQKIEVCQSFFLNTLDISKQRVYYFFKAAYQEEGGVARKPLSGKHVKKITPQEKIDAVKQHIQKFPVVDAHYCRADSNKQYLEAGLSIKKMYNFYLETSNDPVKFCIYSKVFNEQFNLSFFKPKKDQCDMCVKFDKIPAPTEKEKQEYQNHRDKNANCKIERNKDRLLSNDKTVIVCYDLQNVFALPKANTSSFYYKRKFLVFNLTGYCQNNKITYCCIWNENLTGRSGNDIASALIAILNKIIVDLPNTKHLILWSDSCIPQNRNRITSLAILKFLKDNSQISSITQKYSEPGHSRIQELDAVHSVIYKHIKDIEIHGPISLIRILKSIQYSKVALKIMQLKKEMIFNYNKASLGLKLIPYQKAAQILYETSNIFQIKYKTDYLNTSFITVNIVQNTRKNVVNENLFKIEHCGETKKMSKQKQDDLRSMLPFLNIDDKTFYEKIILKD